MIEQAQYYKLVRQYAEKAPVWDSQRILYQTLPDERWDLTLVALRVYGDRKEWLTIMAAAGLDRVSDELPEQVLVLPNQQLILAFKEQAGIDAGGF